MSVPLWEFLRIYWLRYKIPRYFIAYLFPRYVVCNKLIEKLFSCCAKKIVQQEQNSLLIEKSI